MHDPIEDYTLKCNVCSKKFSRSFTLEKHLKYHEKRETYDPRLDKNLKIVPCPVCQKE